MDAGRRGSDRSRRGGRRSVRGQMSTTGGGQFSSVCAARTAPRTKTHLIEAWRWVSAVLLAVLLDALRKRLGACRVVVAKTVGGIVHQPGDGMLVDGLHGAAEIEVIKQFRDLGDLRQGVSLRF